MKLLVAVLVSLAVLLVPGGLMVTAQASDGAGQGRGTLVDDPPSDDPPSDDPPSDDPPSDDPPSDDPPSDDP
ncbi:MAG: hypothetical protein ACKOMX_10635, partial [Actinomycetota bacterium]